MFKYMRVFSSSLRMQFLLWPKNGMDWPRNGGFYTLISIDRATVTKTIGCKISLYTYEKSNFIHFKHRCTGVTKCVQLRFLFVLCVPFPQNINWHGLATYCCKIRFEWEAVKTWSKSEIIHELVQKRERKMAHRRSFSKRDNNKNISKAHSS